MITLVSLDTYDNKKQRETVTNTTSIYDKINGNDANKKQPKTSSTIDNTEHHHPPTMNTTVILGVQHFPPLLQ